MIMKALAGVGLASAVFMAGYYTGYFEHRQDALVDQLKAQVGALRRDAIQAQKDEQALVRYRQNAKELRDGLSEKALICFDEPDAGRLRQLWRAPAG